MEPRSRHYILNDNVVVPAELQAWANWIAHNRVSVALDSIGSAFITTVFTGLDRGYGITPQPLIFESMVLGGKYNRLVQRYSTWDQATRGHDELVTMLYKAETDASE